MHHERWAVDSEKNVKKAAHNWAHRSEVSVEIQKSQNLPAAARRSFI